MSVKTNGCSAAVTLYTHTHAHSICLECLHQTLCLPPGPCQWGWHSWVGPSFYLGVFRDPVCLLGPKSLFSLLVPSPPPVG